MTDNLLTWNLPNFLTIGLMALLFGSFIGLAVAGIGKVTGYQFPSDGASS